MTTITFEVEEDFEDGGYVAQAYTDQNEHIVTQADTVEELKEMIIDALNCHFENPIDIPHQVIMKFVRQEIFAF